MANRDDDTRRRSDQSGQLDDSKGSMGDRSKERDTTPAPVPGSKDDNTRKSQPEKLQGPLSDEGDRSGTQTDQ